MTSGKSTRRAFVGGGVALAAGAAGVGVARFPALAGRARTSLALEVDQISAAGSAPAFGTLLPQSGGGQAPLSGRLRERGSSRVAGRITTTAIPGNDGILQVHTLDLLDGTVVALGPDTGSEFRIASGTRSYAGAQGRVTIRGAATAAPSLDVELEL
jgi:hypothetical protein